MKPLLLRLRRGARVWLFPLLLPTAGAMGVVGSGCDRPTPESIKTWKGTEKGPGKLEDAFKSGSLAPDLRAQAAVALVAIGRAEVVDDALARMSDGERIAVAKAIAPLASEDVSGHLGNIRPPEARDLLFSVRGFLPPDLQATADQTLITSLQSDLASGHTIAGRHSATVIVKALGAKAAPMLVHVLSSARANIVEVPELLAAVGDDAAKAQGAAALLTTAPDRHPIPPAFWKALGTLGGPQAVTWLKAKVEKGTEEEAVAAARALQQRRDPTLTAYAVGLAGNPGVNKSVREEMFGLAELGGPAAQAGLVRIIATDRDEVVRYRAYEAALAAGGAAAVVPALEAFPSGATYKPDDVKDYLVKDVEKIGATAREPALAALRSKSPLARMVGVWALEAPTIGKAADAGELQKLAADKAAVRGFPPAQSVGREATRVAGVLGKRAS